MHKAASLFAIANKLDISALADYDVSMENQSGKTAHEVQPRPKIERKSVAQTWADYCALDHAPKTEFNPTRTAPMPSDRGDRGDRGR